MYIFSLCFSSLQKKREHDTVMQRLCLHPNSKWASAPNILSFYRYTFRQLTGTRPDRLQVQWKIKGSCEDAGAFLWHEVHIIYTVCKYNEDKRTITHKTCYKISRSKFAFVSPENRTGPGEAKKKSEVEVNLCIAVTH